ncbi:MAG TPA: GntR family transcriptional regulator [Rariglobus sp.]|nr:GntR family transcriptional regulator [Rariglobus sp.]
MTRPTESTLSIAHELAQLSPRPESAGAGKSVKYTACKQLVTDAVSTHPAHTRLPSVRVLAENLGISLVTAQRVVTELVADGVLYSRPRAGVYVAPKKSPDNPATARDAFANGPSFESRFTFGTDSRVDFQRPLWTGLVERFGQRYPNTRAELVFVENSGDPANRLDAYERLDWNVNQSADDDRPLDLREFATEDIASRCDDQGVLPLYFRTNYLFFNPGILARCGLSAPDFRTFDEQAAYLAKAAPLLEKHRHEGVPFSVQQPITAMGADHLGLFFSLAESARSNRTELTAFTEAAARTLEFCRLGQRAPGIRNPKAQEARLRFMAGQDAFFLGHTVDYWQFSESRLPFPLRCVPTLNTEDSLFLWPMIGGVTRRSVRPAESTRFLAFLVGPEAQAEFARTGNFPADPATNPPPATEADDAWLAKTRAASKPMHLANPAHFYLAINVLNNELWHALLDHVSVEQAVKEAVHLGRAYLRQQRNAVHA